MTNTPEESANAENDQQPQAIGAVDRLRMLPVTAPFGLRAAALAGLVLTAGAAAAGAAGVFDDPASAVAVFPICSIEDPH
nr:hypothetical protein [Kibdelosporangium sp. MJ126-NF4]CEL12790.1 hypothetical protein [Kibdelosporangium sp. MJ126-NF4]CTQ98476.1 hypothetical protein [Kibdelosporangium sp. MJ126-NF4]